MSIQAELVNQLQSIWHESVQQDETELDIELIAAYVDGELEPIEEVYLARHILESPRAFTLLVESLAPGQSLPVWPDDESLVPDVLVTPSLTTPNNNQSDSPINGFRLWQLAAIVGIAATAISTSFISGLQTEKALLVTEVSELQATRRKLLLAEKYALADANSERQSIYVGGDISPEFVTLAISSIGGTRNLQPPTETEKAYIESSLNSAKIAIGTSGTTNDLIERAITLTWAGKLEQAREVLSSIKESQRTAQYANAEGVLLATHYENVAASEAEEIAAAAVKNFRVAGNGGLAEAWLNLGLFHRHRGEITEATEAAERFLSSSTDVAAKKIVRNWLAAR